MISDKWIELIFGGLFVWLPVQVRGRGFLVAGGGGGLVSQRPKA